ncbi:MAG: glutathione S-transferase family protein [Kiloniellales bacterium]
MSDIVIYGFPQSTYVRTARLACEEKGVAYTLEPIEFGSPKHRALHPFARIPAIKHDELILYETSAIVRYVDEAFDGPALQPSDVVARARMDQWISAINDYYYAAMVRGIIFQRLVNPQRGQPVDEGAVEAAVPQVEHQLGVAEQALSQTRFLAGDALSLADLFLGPLIFWLAMTPEGGSALKKTPAVSNWYETMATRASFAATLPPMPEQSAAE